ncbi:MAG: alcohol dehydrogenase catalytic domain-containing protein, partial [Erysipelotrichales bacterium]|nr:alcohol dehydrogenase catalytic domain-containing protein [Erysipelotrichales bacterium]
MSEIMHAIVFTEKGKVEIREFPKPACDHDKILIKTEYCALCTYEQRVFNGVHHDPLPLIGGHEVSGTVVEVGKELAGSGWEPGQKVVYGVTHPCGV